MVGCGEFESVNAACEALVEVADTVYPDEDLSRLYNKKYETFKEIYPSLKAVFNKEI